MSGMTIQTPLAALSETHLQSLVQNQVAESETLDYKREMYGQNDSDRRELLRDVSSLANRLGGHLLIGIREEGEIPVEVKGIENGEIAAERIMSSCLSGIYERINGFDVRPIQLTNGRWVLAVYVPPSTRVPHMVTAQQEDRFWIRHGRQKMRMSVAELLAIAELTGKKWAEYGRECAIKLSRENNDASKRALLLADIGMIFEKTKVSRLASAEICSQLGEMEEHPWPEWQNGQPITSRQLARLLEPLGIRPRQLRMGEVNIRGYELEDFADVFSRYTVSNVSATPLRPAQDAGPRGF